MAKNLNPSDYDGADWNAAFAAVNRLARARKSVCNLHDESAAEDLPAAGPKDGVDSEALVQAHEEIGRAAAAMQTAQSGLTAWTDNHLVNAQRGRRRGPVWFLIALIWIGIVAIVITAIHAVKTFM